MSARLVWADHARDIHDLLAEHDASVVAAFVLYLEWRDEVEDVMAHTRSTEAVAAALGMRYEAIRARLGRHEDPLHAELANRRLAESSRRTPTRRS